jgi:hypothetical protein
MKKIIFLYLIISHSACTQSYEDKISNILKKHMEPKEKIENKLSVGKTIVFQYGERMGIDRSKYPSPVYQKNIDTNYFRYIKTETIDDGSDGGTEYSFEIYKTLKAGTTKIEVYKMEGKTQNDSRQGDTVATQHKQLSATYNFSIIN